MKALPLALVAAGAALWLLAAMLLVPLASWPRSPLAVGEMSLAQIRLLFGLMPRAAMAMLAGASLGLAGALMQRVLRNPLADPTVLGVSAGAQLALVCATLFAPWLLTLGRMPVALCGAVAATAIVFSLAGRSGFEPGRVVIAGMLVALLASSLATALTLAHGEYLLSLVIWNGGSLVQQDWSDAARLALVLSLCLIVALVLQRSLQLLSLGGETANALGLQVGPARLAMMGVAIVLTSLVAAEVGLIAFIGLAAPTFVRALAIRRETHRLLASAVVGAGLLLVCDSGLLLLSATTGESLPTGAVTGLIGGPLLLWLLPRLAGRKPPGSAVSGPHIGPAGSSRTIAMLLALLVVGIVICLVVGRGPQGWTFLGWRDIEAFLPPRLPRLVAALAAGALLAGSGAILQRLTANPLASPEFMGVSGGAALGYGLAVFLLTNPGIWTVLLFTGLGSAAVLVAITPFALNRNMPSEHILLAGLAISALASAVLSAMMSVGDARAWMILNWLAGSAATVGPWGAGALFGLALLMTLLCVLARRWLAILPLGSDVANALGLPVAARPVLFVAAGIATGTATILVGPVSFVGLMAPHIARAFGLSAPAAFPVGAIVIGAFLMMLADMGARFAAFPYELPLGLFAALLGTPWLLIRMMRNS